MKNEVKVDLKGCSRCGSEGGHRGLVFKRLQNPVALLHEEPLTHWAPCPVSGEPILLRYVDIPDKVTE